jgi:CheY-like chemotaxis protein
MTAQILVVDDDVIVRETITRILEGQGFRVVSADNGNQALGIFRAKRPDLVLTDIIMPDREGIETIIIIRKEQPAARIIAMSGGGRLQNKNFLDLAKALGADEALDKPFTEADLLESVGRCLKRR